MLDNRDSINLNQVQSLMSCTIILHLQIYVGQSCNFHYITSRYGLIRARLMSYVYRFYNIMSHIYKPVRKIIILKTNSPKLREKKHYSPIIDR